MHNALGPLNKLERILKYFNSVVKNIFGLLHFEEIESYGKRNVRVLIIVILKGLR